MYRIGTMHLLLPLLASVLFVCGLILIKRAGAAGVGTATTLFLTNEFSAVIFSSLWLLGGSEPSWTLLWQPAVIALLFVTGLVMTFLAIQRGDVSVATPVFGVKVVFVAFLLTAAGQQHLPIEVWYAAVLATAGIALIQWTGVGHPRRVVFTILLALAAAASYATFDVLVQHWSPAWGTGRFLPIVYWIVGLLSLVMVPWVDWSKLTDRRAARFLWPGAVLIALQAVCIVVTLSLFGDAARVNVIYALRGLWSVALAWITARIWGGAEAGLGGSVLMTRLAGACVLTIAVALVVVSQI